MVPQNSPEDNEASPKQPTLAQCNHLLNKVAQGCVEEENVSNTRRASTSVPSFEPSQGSEVTPRRESGMHLPSSLKGKPAAAAAAAAAEAPDTTMPSNVAPSWLTAELEESIRNHRSSEDSLQWFQALKLQAVGACRSDERLRPLLRWNVSCFGSDGRLLANLGQHFKARELALLARCLCTPVVSLRVGKVSRHGQFLYPTATRGYLNLMLLPCSEMRLSFADDFGTVERVATTMPGVESGGILIEELQEDSSQRTFVVKDRCGNNSNYFWQSEKLKSTGDELITKIRNLLKRRPTLAHLTGIDEGRLDSFGDYLRTAIFSKASKALSQLQSNPTLEPVPSLQLQSAEESSSINTLRRPFRRSLLKLATFSLFSSPSQFENLPSQGSTPPRIIVSSMDKLQRCMHEILEKTSRIPALDKLLESLKRMQNCLHSLTGKAALDLPQVGLSNSYSCMRGNRPVKQVVKLITESFTSRFEEEYHYLPGTISFRTQLPLKIMGPCVLGTINAQQALQPTTVVYRPRYRPVDVDVGQLLVWPAGNETLSNMLTQLVSQVPRMVARLSNETLRTHNLYVLPGAMAHAGTSAEARWSVLPLAIEPAPAPNSSGSCPPCGPGTGPGSGGLGNLVLVTVSAQQTGPRLRVVTTEITSGNISYIVRFLQSF